jgi:hypothetical protein
MVQDYFLAYRGSGVTLSPLDAELLSSWARSGAPFQVIAAGIRRAAEKAAWHARPGDPALRSLRACKRDVESEIRKHRWYSAGATGERRSSRPPRSGAISKAKLRAAFAKLARLRPALTAEIELLYKAAEGSAQGLDDFLGQLDAREARLMRALPFPERLDVLREARAQASPPDRRASVLARKLARRLHRRVALRKKLGLPLFW